MCSRPNQLLMSLMWSTILFGEGQQFLLMKINFDLLSSPTSVASPSKNQPIRIEIQSPVYQKIYKTISPHNYQHQLHSMRDYISMPDPVSQFIAQEINKEILIQTNQHSADQQTFDEAPLEVKQAIQLKEKSKPVKTGAMSWVYKYKKHKCQGEASTAVKKEVSQLSELTLKPKLIPSKTTQRVVEGRKANNMLGKKYSVYECLYKDATKKELKQRAREEATFQGKEAKKPKINNKFFSRHEKVYTPILSRLDQILQNREKVKTKGQNYDLTTGREMFEPNLNLSKNSYKIYFHSLSKEKLNTKRRQKSEIDLNVHKKQSRKEITFQRKPQETIDSKTIKFFVDLFYPEMEEGAQIVHALDAIRQKEFIILQPFLHLVEQMQSKHFEQQTTVSSVKVSGKTEVTLSKEAFHDQFSKFYSGLTLHDRQILRSEVIKRKREKIKMYDDSNMQMTFRPSINVRSCSLDSLVQGHTHQIYFV